MHSPCIIYSILLWPQQYKSTGSVPMFCLIRDEQFCQDNKYFNPPTILYFRLLVDCNSEQNNTEMVCVVGDRIRFNISVSSSEYLIYLYRNKICVSVGLNAYLYNTLTFLNILYLVYGHFHWQRLKCRMYTIDNRIMSIETIYYGQLSSAQLFMIITVRS